MRNIFILFLCILAVCYGCELTLTPPFGNIGERASCSLGKFDPVIRVYPIPDQTKMRKITAYKEHGVYHACETNCRTYDVPDVSTNIYQCESGQSTLYPRNISILSCSSTKREVAAAPYVSPECNIWFNQENSIVMSPRNMLYIASRLGKTWVLNCTSDPCYTTLSYTSEDMLHSGYLFVAGYYREDTTFTYPICQNTMWVPAQAVCDLYGGIICCPKYKLTCKILYNLDTWVVIITLFILAYLLYHGAILSIIGYLITSIFRLFRQKKYIAVPLDAAKFLIIMFAMVCSACDTFSYVDSEVETCFYDSDSYVCDIYINGQLTLPFRGGMACMSFMSNGTQLGTLNVTYEALTVDITTSKEYGTYNWWFDQLQAYKCYGSNGCMWGRCDNIGIDDDLSDYGCGDPFLMSYPGRSSCQTGGVAGWDKACFITASTCIYSRWATVFLGYEIPVYRPLSINYSPNITLRSSWGAKSSLVSSIPTSLGPFTIQTLGTYTPSLTQYQGKKFIVANGYTYLGSAADAGEQVCGSVGDIQCMSNDHTECKGIEHCVSSTINGQQLVYTYPAPGAIKATDGIRLPGIFGTDMLLKKTDAHVLGESLNPSSTVISISTPGSIRIKTTISKVCPRGVVNSAGGTTGNNLGAWINLTLYSDCLSGVVYIASNDFSIVTQSFTITKVAETYILLVYIEKSKAGHVNISGTGGSLSLAVDLVVVDNEYDMSETTYSTTSIGTPLFSAPSWPDALVAFLNWLPIVLFITLVISGFVAVVLFVKRKFK